MRTGASISAGADTAARGAAGMGAAGHIDADEVDLAALEEQTKQVGKKGI